MEAETDDCSTWPPTPTTDEWFSYDKNGRMTDMWEMTPHSGGYYHTSVVYFPNGAVSSLSGIPGYTAYTYGVDGEGRASTTVQGSASIISGVTFDPSSKPRVVSIGTAGDNDTYTYDPATGRMGTYTFSVNGTTDVGTLTWNANGTLQQLAVVDGFNSGGTQTCNYLYDDVGRLGVPPNSPPPPGNPTTYSVDCGSSLWRQVFSYDQYDNLTKTGNPGITWNPGYDAANNRYSTIGATYDSDGHVTYDSFNTYTWDGYGKMSSVNSGTIAAVCGTSGTCVTYDASGRAVEKNVSGRYSEILYSPIGEIAIMNGASTVTQSYISLPGGMSMTATGAGGTGQRQMEHHDWLGTVRLSTLLGNRTVVYDRAFAPYGENYDNFGSTTSLNFTGDKQDIFPGLFDTPNRELNPSQGRWLSPDPAGEGWNLYAYSNNPNSDTDPSGLWAHPHRMTNKAFGNGCAGIGGDDTGSDCLPPWENTSYTVNGADVPAWVGLSVLSSGTGGLCPNNDCNNIKITTTGEIYQKQYDSNPDIFQCGDGGTNWSCYPTHWVSVYLGKAGDGLPSSVLCVYIGGTCDVPLSGAGQQLFQGNRQLWHNADGTMKAVTATYAAGFTLVGGGAAGAITLRGAIISALVLGQLNELLDYVLGGDPPPEHNPNWPPEPGCNPCEPDPPGCLSAP